MTKRISIAAARNQFPAVVHEVERGCTVEIARRGKPVAVLISIQEYDRLSGRGTFWDAVQEWRKTVDWDELGDIEEVFKDVRDKSPGRDFQW